MDVQEFTVSAKEKDVVTTAFEFRISITQLNRSHSHHSPLQLVSCFSVKKNSLAKDKPKQPSRLTVLLQVSSWISVSCNVTSFQKACGDHSTAYLSTTRRNMTVLLSARLSCELSFSIYLIQGQQYGITQGLQRLMMTECNSREALTRTLEWVHQGWNSCVVAWYPQERKTERVCMQSKNSLTPSQWLTADNRTSCSPCIFLSLHWIFSGIASPFISLICQKRIHILLDFSVNFAGWGGPWGQCQQKEKVGRKNIILPWSRPYYLLSC